MFSGVQGQDLFLQEERKIREDGIETIQREMKTIEIKCKGASELELDEIFEFQGKLKNLTKKNFEKLRDVILKYGFSAPIFIWKNGKQNNCLDGHGRLRVLKELKKEGFTIPKLPVVWIKAKNRKEAKEKLLTIASQYQDYDEKGFGEFIELEDINLEEIGGLINIPPLEHLIERENVVINPEDDEIPEVRKTKIKLGDMFALGNHRVLCGDATKKEDVAKLMQGEKVDMIFTDPPYGVDYSSKNEDLNKWDNGNRNQKEIENDAKSVEDMGGLWFQVFSVIKDYLASYNSYYICSPQGGELLMMMMMMMQKSGLGMRHMIIWNKNNHVLGRTDYNYKHEPLLYGWFNKHKFYGNGQFKFSVWDIAKPQKSDLHPTMKPVELMINAILNSTLHDMIVLDVFGGSGSTLIACEKTERQCRMMEIDPQYCQVIIDRWEKLTGKKSQPFVFRKPK